jgi:hypothetical protein
MDTEYTGPVEIWGTATFPEKGLWDVHGPFKTEARYANGVHMIISDSFPNGIRFEGTDGWLFVSRGDTQATASDPVSVMAAKKLDAGNPKILESMIGPNETAYKAGNSPLLRLKWDTDRGQHVYCTILL